MVVNNACHFENSWSIVPAVKKKIVLYSHTQKLDDIQSPKHILYSNHVSGLSTYTKNRLGYFGSIMIPEIFMNNILLRNHQVLGLVFHFHRANNKSYIHCAYIILL